MISMTERVRILNTEVDNYTMDEAVDAIRNMVLLRGNAYVVTPNLDHLINIDEDPEFEAAYRDADLILADGISLVLLAKLLHVPLKEKVSGSDLFPRVCAMAAREGFSLYILGAAEGVAEKAGEKMQAKNPGLVIAGTYSPPFGFENDEEEIRQIIEKVTDAKPDIMAIALGGKKGEKFIHQYRDKLSVPLSMSVGAAIDFAAGNIKRAPAWVSRSGFEWLYRAVKEPNRIGKRVIRDILGLFPLIRKYK